VVDLGPRVWEPACGDGSIVKVLVEAGHDVRATDLRTGVDFLASDQPWDGAIVTNPPYSHWDAFTHHALDLVDGEHPVAMLMPVPYLGGVRRNQALWSARPPSEVVVVARRMPFEAPHNNGRTSQFNHAWAVWNTGLGISDDALLRWVP